MVRLVARRRARWRRARPTGLLSPLGPPLGTARSGPTSEDPSDEGARGAAGTAPGRSTTPARAGRVTARSLGRAGEAPSDEQVPGSPTGPLDRSAGSEAAAPSEVTGGFAEPIGSTAGGPDDQSLPTAVRPPVLAPPVRIRVLRTDGEVAEARARAADQLRRIEAAMGPGATGRAPVSSAGRGSTPAAAVPAPSAGPAPAAVPAPPHPATDGSPGGEPRSAGPGADPDRRSDGPGRR